MTRVTTSAGAPDPAARPRIPTRPFDAADREATLAAPYLQAIAFTAQTFLGGERLEERIPAVLCRLGEVAQASRAYLFECEATPGGRRWSQRYEWVAPGITPQMDNPTLQDVSLVEIGFGRWEKLLERGGIIHGLRADAPESEQKVMAEQDILSLAAVPIFVEQRWWGFIGFDDCVRGRSWSPGVLDFLRAAADLFGATLARNELDERYRALVEATVEGVVIHDGETILDANPGFLRVLGYEQDEVIGQDPFSFVAPDSLELARSRVSAASRQPYEAKVRRKDGTVFPAQLKGDAIHYRGRSVRFVSVLDLTAAKEAEENARRLVVEQVARERAEAAEERAAFLAEVSRVLATSLDISTTWAHVARVSVPFLGDRCAIDVFDDDTVRRVATASAQQSPSEAGEALDPSAAQWSADLDRIRRVQESGRPLLVAAASGAPVAHSGALPVETISHEGACSEQYVPIRSRDRVLGVISLMCTGSGCWHARDHLPLVEELATRAALAVENAALYNEAQEATRSRDHVLATVAHDLRNPVGAVLSGAAMILEQWPAAPVLKFAEIIHRAAERMNQLIQDLLEIRRLEGDQLQLQLGPVDVDALLAEATAMLRPLSEAQAISIESEVIGPIPPVRADAGRLLQVLSNIVGNAIKFSPPRSRVIVRCQLREPEVSFAVIDAGPGIPGDLIPHLFAPFWQADATDRRGIGLGLSIARGIVEAHAGRIWVDSEPGRGSTFHFTLPVERSAPKVPAP